MSENNYQEAWEYTMKVLHDNYKTQNKEDEFKLWFNMDYVEDTIDTITVSATVERCPTICFLSDALRRTA